MHKILTILLFAGVAQAATADTVMLTNGDRLTGKVDSISGGEVLLETEYAGHIAIKLDAIAQLQTEEAFDVVTANGKVSGKFQVENDAQVLVAESVAQPVAITDVQNAGQNKLGLAQLGSEWSTRADLAASFSNGNTDTEQYSTLIESVLKQDVVQHSLSFLVANEKAEDETTRDELDLDYGYKRFVSEKWYASGNAEYFQDQLKDVDSRITLGAGMGYQFWDDSFGAFSSELGVSYVREELDGENESNPALRWGLDYNRYLMSKQLEVFHKHSLLFIPDSDRGEVFQSSSGLRYALNARISAVARVDVRHETEPAEDAGRTDVTYNLGIGVKF